MKRTLCWLTPAIGVMLLAACDGEDHSRAAAGDRSASKEEGVHSTPEALVKAFFKALESDDRTTMSRLMTPERAERMESSEAWAKWLAVWKEYEVLRVGEVLTENEADGNLPQRVKVRVEYRSGERTIKDFVSVSRIDGLWYWDEN